MLLILSTFLWVTGSLLACVDNQLATSEAGQYPDKAAKKVNELTLKQTVFVQARDQNMLVNLGDFAFILPGNWRDTSRYTYKSKQQNIALTVSFGKTRDAIPLEKFVAQRRQELIDTMGDEVEFLSQEQCKSPYCRQFIRVLVLVIRVINIKNTGQPLIMQKTNR